jgi:zinc finger protein 830
MKEKGSEKRVESPYAKYNAVGQLWCTLCNCPIKTNLLWSAHILGRTHKENVNAQLRTGPVNVLPSPSAIAVKRKAVDTDDCNGIEKKHVKNDSSCSAIMTTSLLPVDFFDNKPSATGVAQTSDVVTLQMSHSHSQTSATVDVLIKDFVDTSHTVQVADNTAAVSVGIIAEKLPEGFFDDPKLDAKVRQVPYRDKMEDEWELFQKSMKEESMVSEALVEEDDEQREEERNIEEIDDQLNRWSRVTSLLKKKEEITTVSSNQQKSENMSDSDIETTEFDEFLDWRSKKAWK